MLILVSALAVLGIGFLIMFLISYVTRVRYTRAKLLTPGELEFFRVLDVAVRKKYSVFAQVRLANLVNIPDKYFLWKNFNQLGAKCVDFVLYDKNTGSTLIVIELDDKSHERPERKTRDEFVNKVLKEAKIPILHLKYKYQYNIPEILNSIAEKIQE